MFRQLNMAVFLLLLISVSMEDQCASKNEFQNKMDSEKTETCFNPVKNQVVELAIFYDMEFAQTFNSDPKEIQKFWEVVLFDIHCRFDTLPNVHVSFRVTVIGEINLEISTNLAYTRTIRRRGKTWGANENLFPLFQNFVYYFKENIPNFHIAVLALGNSNFAFNFIPDTFSVGSICQEKNSRQKKWTASTVISIGEFPNPAEILAMRIASIMGAQPENLLDICDCHKNFCGTMQKRMIPMSKSFSTCVDTNITQRLAKLQSEGMLCLSAAKANQNPIIDSAKLFQNPEIVHAYTIAEQCKIFRNDIQTDMVAEFSAIECTHAVCLDKATYMMLFDFTPLERTRCGKHSNGWCSRDACIQMEK